MRADSGRALRLILALLLLAIAVLFIAQLNALIAHRLDYPIVDDWSYYLRRARMPRQLTLEWLFFPALDTLHVTGKLLDWLFFRLVAHDYRDLAITSFVLVYGGWLVCAVLVCLIVGRDRPAILVSSLLAFVFPLANMPYWVSASPGQWLEPAIAYHQMLPLLGLLLVSLVGLSRWGQSPRVPVIALLALLTGVFSLAYSSGAVSMLVLGIALTGCARIDSRRRGGERGPLVLGTTVAAVAGACLVAHVVVPLVVHGGNPITATRAEGPTLPWSGIFWHFFFGLFDRAVLSTQVSVLSFLRGAGVALVVIAPLLLLPLLLWRRRFDVEERRRVAIVLAIGLAVACYSVLVTYGRASFGDRYFPETHSPSINASLYAHNRFFYWWISSILPLIVLAWGLIVEKLCSRRTASWAAVGLVLLAILPKAQDQDFGALSYLDHWSYSARYARDAAKLVEIIGRDRLPYSVEPRELALGADWARLDGSRRNPRFRPGDRDWMPGDHRHLYQIARGAGATFVERWGLSSGTGPAQQQHIESEQ